MKIVADTNVFLAVALSEPEKTRVIELTAGHEIIAPELLPYEIGNALSAMMKKKRLTHLEAQQALAFVNRVPVQLVTPNISASLDIASRFNIYAYDAYFIQIAVHARCALLTLDRKMIEVAQSMNISVLR